ncbi:MAG TPA: flagellar hook-basal body complex protein FliE [Blastocatellia bacterium]|nr:flagellar hook-basal body complex protein FliE [Blastocatellia bacterium]
MEPVGTLPLKMPVPIAAPTLTGSMLGAGASSFGEYIKTSVETLDRTQKNAEMEIGKAVTGESQDLHKTIVALQTADLSFQLALQVRNKFINAFEEVMRMQV